jgi:polyphosphate kinase
VEDDRIRGQLLDVLDRCLADNTNAWVLGQEGSWLRRRPNGEPRNVQRELIEIHETRAT